MTRMFTGSRGDSSGGNVNPIFAKHEKRSAKKMFMDKARGIDESKLTPEERHQRMVDKKIDELRTKALGGGTHGYRFTLPGTEQSEPPQLSKNMEAFIRKLAIKKAKEEEKKMRERASVEIKARPFAGMQGGRIDAKGRIYGPDNRWVASVNPKTGKVTSRSGTYICKYNAKSTFAEHQIAQFIAKEYRPGKATFMGGCNGHGTAGGGIYGGGGIHGTTNGGAKADNTSWFWGN